MLKTPLYKYNNPARMAANFPITCKNLFSFEKTQKRHGYKIDGCSEKEHDKEKDTSRQPVGFNSTRYGKKKRRTEVHPGYKSTGQRNGKRPSAKFLLQLLLSLPKTYFPEPVETISNHK